MAVADTSRCRSGNHFRFGLVTKTFICLREGRSSQLRREHLPAIFLAQKAVLESLDSQLGKSASFKPLKRLHYQESLKFR